MVRLSANPGVSLAVTMVRCCALFDMNLLLQDDIRHLLVKQMIIWLLELRGYRRLGSCKCRFLLLLLLRVCQEHLVAP